MTALLVITNAAAGSADRRAVETAVAVLRAGAGVTVVATGSPAECRAVIAERGDRRPVACGGDGSLQVVVDALRRSGGLAEPVGLIPLGTGNDLARAVGVPLDPAEAARVVLTGVPQPLDLLVDDADGLVINAVHLGVGAQAARTATALKPRLGKAAYAVGGVVAGLRSPGWRLRVEVDGDRLATGDRRLLQVAVGLGRSVGGGSPLTPQTVLDDGLADVVVSAAVGPLARLRYGLRMRRGDHLNEPEVTTARGRTVLVHGEPFPYNTDGEVHGPVRRRVWTIAPEGWRLLVPAGTDVRTP